MPGTPTKAQGYPTSPKRTAEEVEYDELQGIACWRDLEKYESWFTKDVGYRENLKHAAIAVASACPSRVRNLIEVLIQGIAQRGATAIPGGESLTIGTDTFESRTALKEKCQELLKLHQDDEQLQKEDADFILRLLAHHPRGAEKVHGCQAVVAGIHPSFHMRCFHVVREGGREDFSYVRCVDNAPTFQDQCANDICDVLCKVLELHPGMLTLFVQQLESRYPVPQANAQMHRNYARAILHLCSLMPKLVETLFIMLVRKMVAVDTKVNRLEAELPDETAQDEKLREKLCSMAHLLDGQMMLVFEFLQRHLATMDAKNDTLALMLLSTFESAVMSTTDVKCVHFLWFYLASLRPSWTEAFLSMLLQIAYSPTETPERRSLALQYLASFLARAKFVTVTYAIRTTQYLAMLTREQMEAAERGGAQTTPATLKLVLGLVQAVSYIICWWVKEFSEEEFEPGVSALEVLLPAREARSESFSPVLESQHCPLARIRRFIAIEFCRQIRPHRPQLAAILMQQLRHVPVARQDVDEGKTSAFYPFDPYRLRNSRIFLMGIYREWTVANDDSELEDSDQENSDAGFIQSGCEDSKRRARSGSIMSSSEAVGEEALSDADFTDEANVIRRGFSPAVKPSPAFAPRLSTADMGDITMSSLSPLLLPGEGVAACADDDFSLPQASLDMGCSAAMSDLLRNPAYRSLS